MRFGGFRIPRDLGFAISNGAYLTLVLIPTAACVLLTVGSVLFEVWDVSVYDAAALPMIAFNRSSSTGSGNSTLVSNSSLDDSLSNVFEVLDDGAVLFDSRGRCENTVSGLNGSFLTEERGGIWRLYRVFTDDDHKALAEELCNVTVHSLNYLNQAEEIDFYCCGGCCPFEPEWRYDADRAGETTHDALYTMMSAVIVALILQGVSVLMILVALCNQSVTLCRMSGVTIFVSGLFLMFALAINHYKISIMNTGFRSIPYLSTDVLSIRRTTVGWCMYVAWAAVFISAISATLLIQFSRFMVKLALEMPNSAYQMSNDKKTGLLSRPMTAIDQVRTARAKSATNRLSSSTNPQPNSSAASNGHANSSFVAVQEL